jgi:hypothetical protein
MRELRVGGAFARERLLEIEERGLNLGGDLSGRSHDVVTFAAEALLELLELFLEVGPSASPFHTGKVELEPYLVPHPGELVELETHEFPDLFGDGRR